MVIVSESEGIWGSRRKYIVVLLCQMIGQPMFAFLPNVALKFGAAGFMLTYLLIYFFFGIPLLYMEFIISQFTARDCIDVWKARPCLSHVGYIILLWQIFTVICNHMAACFTLHYLLISFENPIPYYTCGSWATINCNMAVKNYTINEDCLRHKDSPPYCKNLYKTFTEYQHWRYNILGMREGFGIRKLEYTVTWRICLASTLIVAITFLSNFKREKSIEWFVNWFTFYPIFGYTVLLMGSMIQKGVVILFENAFDADFQIFYNKFKISVIICQVVLNTGIGSGFTFSLGSRAPFRSPCYANTVIAVMACAATSALSICTSAMMTCPYSYEFSIEPYQIINTEMAWVYEKIPTMLEEYRNKLFWIVLTLSCQAVLVISTNVILVYHLLQMLATRFSVVEKCPGLTTLAAMTLLYFGTMPLLGAHGMSVMYSMRRYSHLLSTFAVIVETFVFVFLYGVDRFSEDIHFMQGLQPKQFMKISWLCSGTVLCYVFVTEFYNKLKDYNGTFVEQIGFWWFMLSMNLMVGLFILKLLFAAVKKNFLQMISLDSSWGPRNEVLQRSRAMFTAQAMTKEYMYRQYHLQAGVLARQRAANCRLQEDSLENPTSS